MSKTNGYHQYFSPDQIAKYLEEGEFRIPGWRGNAYCDEELTTIELTKPTSESWVAVEPITKMGDSLNGQLTYSHG